MNLTDNRRLFFFVFLLLWAVPFWCAPTASEPDSVYSGPRFLPKVHSQVYTSYLEDPNSYSSLQPLADTGRQFQSYVQFPANATTRFPISSLKRLEQAVYAYFTTNDSTQLLYYQPLASNQRLALRILFGAEYHSRDDQSYILFHRGFKYDAQLAKHLSMHAYWWSGNFTENNELTNSSPIIDTFVQPSVSNISLDNLQGDVTYANSLLRLSLGRGKFQVGNSIAGSIILNNIANDYGYLESRFHLGKLDFSFMHGTLIPDSTSFEQGQDTYLDKYIALHQLDWKISSKLHTFIGEQIIYGNRTIDVNYLLPAVFWRIIEHNTRDRDNVMIFGGLNWQLSPLVLWYGNGLLDEFSQKKILTNWWGNKYALQTGLAYHGHINATAEITAVRPWTYTHKIMWNKYSHDGRPLGFPFGSNCISAAGEIFVPIHPYWSAGAHFSYTRQGSVGNQYYLNYGDLIPPQESLTLQTKWLEGSVTNTVRMKAMLDWHYFAHHFLRAGIFISHVQHSGDVKPEFSFAWHSEF